MKKLFVVALAALGMVACVNEDVVETPKSDAIAFDQVYIDNAVRAAAADPSFVANELTSFDVWAFMDNATGVVFESEDVTKDGNYWSYENIQYWFPGHDYYFAAVAPVCEDWKLEALAADEYAGLGTISFENENGGLDLLYATQKVSTQGMTLEDIATNGMPAVKLDFEHLLSKVKFTFKNGFNTTNADVVVRDIKMVAPKAGQIDLAGEKVWTNVDQKALAFGDVERLDMQQSAECAYERLSIPAAADYVYEISFTVDVYVGEVKAMTHELTSSVTGIALEMGKGYNFAAVITPETLDLQKIEFTVEVKAWDEYTNVTSPAAYVANVTELQAALDANIANIILVNDIEGDVKATQKANTEICIDGQGHSLKGVVLVDGKSATIKTAALTIKNVNFNADAISADAIVRLGNGTNATRYTCNVTVDNCTFDVPGAVGVKSYTGGDKNLTIKNCVATANAHSLVQAKGIDGILIEGCEVYSKNGMNFNNSTNVVVDGCTAEVKGYAARFGEGSASNGAAEVYTIKNSTLKSACEEDGDAVIVLRGTADKATLTLENTTLVGTPDILNNAVGATVVTGAVVYNADELNAALADSSVEYIVLGEGEYGVIVAKSNKTIVGTANAKVNAISLNGAENLTLKNITFDAATAIVGYDGKGNGKQYANIVTDNVKDSKKPSKGAYNIVIDGCTFEGTFTNGGAAIAFTDQNRSGGFSGNITIKNCVFNTVGGYYDIYGHYVGNGQNGYGDFAIENNVFKTSFTQGDPVYLGRYASSTPVVVKGNTFETVTSLEAAVYLQDHSNYGVSVNASNNTFAE